MVQKAVGSIPIIRPIKDLDLQLPVQREPLCTGVAFVFYVVMLLSCSRSVLLYDLLHLPKKGHVKNNLTSFMFIARWQHQA